MPHHSHPSSWDFNRDPEFGTPNLPSAAAVYGPTDNELYVDEDTPIGWGKHRNLTIRQVLYQDPSWLDWAVRETGRIVLSAESKTELAALLADLSNNRTKTQPQRPISNYRPGGYKYR